jgi:hypothetical protein
MMPLPHEYWETEFVKSLAEHKVGIWQQMIEYVVPILIPMLLQ